MKRKIIASLLSCMFIMSLNNSFAINENKPTKLTYEEAVKKALLENVDLKILDKNDEKADVMGDKVSNTSKGIYSSGTGQGASDYQFSEITKAVENVNISKTKLQKMSEFTTELTKFKVKMAFYNIDKVNKDIELIDLKIKNSKDNQILATKKFDVGMESKLTDTTSKISVDKLVEEKKKLMEDREKEYIQLNKLLGFPQNQKFEIEPLEIEYNKIKKSDAELLFRTNKAIENDVTLWTKEKDIDLKKMDVDLYVFNVENPKIALPPQLGGKVIEIPIQKTDPYQAKVLDVSIAEEEVEKTKLDIKESVAQKYNNLQKLEAAYESLLKDKELVDVSYKALEKKYEVGMATKIELDNLKLKKNELDNGFYQIELQHAILKEMYENPLFAGLKM